MVEQHKHPATDITGLSAGTPLVTAISGTTVAGTSLTTEYFYYCTAAPLTLTIPTPVGRSLFLHVKNGAASGLVTITAPAGLLEDVTSLTLSPGEAFDLYPINGIWRVL